MLDTRVAGPESAAAAKVPRTPKYWALKQHLLDLLRAVPPGSPIPTERSLAADFDVSRTTVRQALAELTVEGRLHRVQGKGTFAAEPKLAHRLNLSSDTIVDGLEPFAQLVDVDEVPADAELGVLLDVAPGSTVVRLRRLRLADGEPMAVEAAYLPAARFPGLRRCASEGESVYEVLRERYGVRLGRVEQTIETTLAGPREAELLRADVGLPMLSLARQSFDSDGVPVEWLRATYRGDRYKFVATLNQP
jgi:GntR family transcriptional regulator